MASAPTHDVVCIGNAIFDILAEVDDGFLVTHGCIKGAMTLVDEAHSAALYDAFPPATEKSGGSAANTAAGIASLGGRVRYIGKVNDDQFGHIYRHDLRAAGVAFDTTPLADGPATATSLIAVTPDGERTMHTCLGACVEVGPEDIREAEISAASILYIEGYMWDRPGMKAAVLKAIDLAHSAGRKVALSLSDSFCVDRFHGEFQALVRERVDILFANAHEITALYETDDLQTAARLAGGETDIAAITRSELGSLLVTGSTILDVAPIATELRDSTGAGDLYAAGLLYGLANDLPLADCGRLASFIASEVIRHMGARPAAGLRESVQKRLGLSLPSVAAPQKASVA